MRRLKPALIPLAVALALAAAAYSGRGAAPRPPQAHAPLLAQPAHAGTATAQTVQDRVRVMDEGHEAGVKAFPAATAGQGAQLLTPEIIGGVKVFKITASEIDWEITPGVKKTAFAYNGAVPGPTIRVTEGDRVRIILKNNLKESTSIHFHGLLIPNKMDGVPFITQPPVKPGESFTYEFTVRNPGSHMYHSHHAADRQVPLGLLGAFIIGPKNKSAEPKVSQDQILILNDGFFGYTINGKGFPATTPIVAKQGEVIRVRFMNEGLMIHPMHLHGMPMRVISADGYPVPQSYQVDTLNISPGQRFDVLIRATEAGVWAFHCHLLNHAESDHGMHGMVTALIVK